MKVELRDLEILAALARHRHFTRAAEACGISQPALSSRIANLENVIGMSRCAAARASAASPRKARSC